MACGARADTSAASCENLDGHSAENHFNSMNLSRPEAFKTQVQVQFNACGRICSVYFAPYPSRWDHESSSWPSPKLMPMVARNIWFSSRQFVVMLTPKDNFNSSTSRNCGFQTSVFMCTYRHRSCLSKLEQCQAGLPRHKRTAL